MRTLRVLWWLYFAFIAWSWVRSLIDLHGIPDFVLSIFNGYGVVGLWGYLRGTIIGWRTFWVVYFVFFIAEVGYSVLPAGWLGVQSGSLVVLSMVVGAALVCVPQGVALWRYAFHNQQAWRSARGTA